MITNNCHHFATEFINKIRQENRAIHLMIAEQDRQENMASQLTTAEQKNVKEHLPMGSNILSFFGFQARRFGEFFLHIFGKIENLNFS